MKTYPNEIIYTTILLIIVITTIFLIRKAIHKFSFVRSIDINRRKVIFYLSYIVVYLLSTSILAVIWGFDFRQIIVALSSILAILGVGFFAQWSILSNLTASALLFFNHPLRIGDRIKIIDKDYDYTGTVIDITGFFLFIKTDAGKNITIPTSTLMQKSIEILENLDWETTRKKDKKTT